MSSIFLMNFKGTALSLKPPKGSSGGEGPFPPGLRPRPLPPSPGDGVCLAATSDRTGQHCTKRSTSTDPQPVFLQFLTLKIKITASLKIHFYHLKPSSHPQIHGPCLWATPRLVFHLNRKRDEEEKKSNTRKHLSVVAAEGQRAKRNSRQKHVVRKDNEDRRS